MVGNGGDLTSIYPLATRPFTHGTTSMIKRRKWGLLYCLTWLSCILTVDESQSKLQRGFTAKTSLLNAAFPVSEAIAKHTDMKNPMALVTLDAEKAFDRVWHERLFQKLYKDGIQGKLWLLNALRSTSAWDN